MKKFLHLTVFFFTLYFWIGQSEVIAQTISSQKGLTTAIFNRKYDESAQNINKPNIPGPAGLQVNSFSGGLFYQRTDLHIPNIYYAWVHGGLSGPDGTPIDEVTFSYNIKPSIDLTFYYNSATTKIDLGYGPGWSMTYSMDVRMEGVNVAIRRADGRKDVFIQSGPGYTAPVGIFDTLIQYLPGKFQLTTKTGMNYFFDDPSHKRLTKITDRNNNQLTITYTSGLPTTITDASGRSVTLTYTSGHLTDITDANFSPARQITFVNDLTGNPVKVINAIGDSVKYEYDQVRNMTKLTDQSGNVFNINYLNCVNVAGITSPLNSMTFSYDTALLKTTVIEPVNSINQSTSFQFNASGNLQEKMGNCCGYHQLYNYDAQNNVTQRTDANGKIYTYTHDAKGNTTQETDPLSGVSSYVYEPVFNRITSATDKNGNGTTYSYDANGNLITVNHPLAITEQFTYDGNGNVLSYTDGRGFTTTYGYNAYGDRTLITYPGGATNSFTYDNVGNLLTSMDANGNTTTYEYDKLNRLKKTTDALANITTYAYDSRSNLISVTDALSHTTSYAYDALNRRISTTTPAGTSSMTYDEKGNMLTSTDNNGNVATYSYNTQNLLATETDALSHTRSYTYDANGNQLSVTDFNGNLTTYTYDDINRMIQLTDALANNTTYAYDANSNNTSITDANSHTTTYVYDALNRTIQIVAVGPSLYTYDANNNKTSATDANGHVTTYTYDNRNRTTVITDALSHTTSYAYDAQGNRISSTDRNGNTTTYTYDALNRNITRANPAGETTTTVYDAIGRTTTLTLPTGHITTYSYDAADRPISYSDNLGLLKSYTYDANSNRLTETDALGHTNSYAYDALSRLITATDPLTQARHYTYDNNSNLLTEQDRNGNTTSYLYDALNRMTQITYPAGNKIQTAYDAVGNILSKTDDNVHVTQYSYDANDRLITETYADASMKQYTYDADGKLITRTDNNGMVTNYTYDAVERLTLRDYPGVNDDAYSYDFEGRLMTANNSNASINFNYNNADRLLSETMNGKTTAYSYDIPNKKRTLTYPSGRIIEENYDVRMRLTLIKDGAANLAGYNYDVADRMLSRFYIMNATNTNYSYNNNDWCTSVNHSPGIAQFIYTFDNEGNRITAAKSHRPTNSEKYTYNSDDRLVNYKEGTLSGGNIPSPLTQTQFNYDGVGNRTSIVKDALTTTYTANPVNKYTTINSGSSISPTYDANGNTGNDGVYNYQYDFENRLINVNSGATAIYKYDALGRRIQKVTPAGTINYYYDGQRIIEERNVADVMQATYVYGTGMDDILNMKRGGINYFYHQNSLGSIAAVTNITGNVVERYEYDAYGKPTIYNGAYVLQPATAIGNTYMFTGREYDAETANYHYRARFYKPDWGRFGQWDPNENSIGTSMLGNQYIYASNNSINHKDPLGLDDAEDKKLKDWAEKAKKAAEDKLKEELEKAKDKIVDKCKEKVVDAIGETAAETAGLIIEYTKFELETAKAIIDAGGKIANRHSACILCHSTEDGHRDGKSWVGGKIKVWEWNVWRFGFNEYTILCKVVNGTTYALVPVSGGGDIWVPCW